jgi:hypothetical protein
VVLHAQRAHLFPRFPPHLVGAHLACGFPQGPQQPGRVAEQQIGAVEGRPVDVQGELPGRGELPLQRQPGDGSAGERRRQPSPGDHIPERLGVAQLDGGHVCQRRVRELARL